MIGPGSERTPDGGGAPARRAAILVLGVWLTSAAGGALAAIGGVASDDAPVDPDLDTEKMRRAGPFWLRPFLLLKDVGYDDNIRLEAQDPEGDATATGGGGLDALLLTGDRGGLRLFQQFDYVAFGENTDLNHWNSASRARGVLRLKGSVLSAEDRYTSIQERHNAEIDQRVRRKTNRLTLAGRSVTTGRLGVRAYARHERIDYTGDDAFSSDVARRLDRDENSLSLEGEFRVLPKTTFTVEGVVERVDFEDDSEGRDSRSQSAVAGFRFDPSAVVEGGFNIGVVNLEAADRPASDYDGTIGEGLLAARLGRRARLKATFVRDLIFSTTVENLFYIGTTWTAAWEQFFSRRVSGELLYGRGLNHYPIPVSGPGGAPLIRDDDIIISQVALRFRVDERLSLQISGQRQERDSTDDRLDRERNLVGFGMNWSF